jgi:hypothetical protein
MQVEIWRSRGQRLRMDGLEKLVSCNPRPPLAHMASDIETIERVHDSLLEGERELAEDTVEVEVQAE